MNGQLKSICLEPALSKKKMINRSIANQIGCTPNSLDAILHKNISTCDGLVRVISFNII